MVNGDTDTREDIFARSFNADIGEYVTRQVSLGPIGGNDAYDSLFKASRPTAAGSASSPRSD